MIIVKITKAEGWYKDLLGKEFHVKKYNEKYWNPIQAVSGMYLIKKCNCEIVLINSEEKSE